ncbi:phosphate ABC transporter substrate-binding protein [Helicobacter aurati]|uniref:Phosphate ABC transporter substrate-binding protein n=1 Tax=Helicobacter aurati TaxID=137778 RepID=A0A3D8J9N5_9HELI|nr:substrate-binding domain-containing protein [Helicobacter aurati]RDU73816.1 phosphate ABC transporter substrate-binding protein [Helicobacter aurati]
MKKTLLACITGMLLAHTITLNAQNIYPITREMGSGTRSAFVEIFGIQKDIKGKKIDSITKKAEVTNSTGVMITSVANSENAIGYISLGSLNDTIKAIRIDGFSPSIENIKNKSYKISRPFNVVIKASTPLSDDFLHYAIHASDIIQKAGYIPTTSNVNKKNANHTESPAGKLIIAGSSSVTPLIEKLVESYTAKNPHAQIEIQQSDSTTGINSVLAGIADIGMVSREVKKSELDKGLHVKILAIDGLAVIVNKNNPISNLSKNIVAKIFSGEITSWAQIK